MGSLAMVLVVMSLGCGEKPEDTARPEPADSAETAPPDGDDSADSNPDPDSQADSEPPPETGDSTGDSEPPTGPLFITAGDFPVIFEAAENRGALGTAVSGVGDLTGDGVADLCITAPELASGTGYLYIMGGPATVGGSVEDYASRIRGPSADGHLSAPGSAGTGDVNADGYPDLLLRSSHQSSNGDADGAAYVVLGPFSSWINLGGGGAEAVILPESTDSIAQAHSSASLGDLDGDGDAEVVVGGRGENGVLVVSVFEGPVSGEHLMNEAEGRIEGAMSLVDASGDLDSDGSNDLLVVDAFGNIELFAGPVVGLHEHYGFGDASVTEGHAVATGRDVDGDGHHDLLVGDFDVMVGEDLNAGSAYLVLGPIKDDLVLTSDAHATILGTHKLQRSGKTVDLPGDVDGDGLGELLIGCDPYYEYKYDGVGGYLVLGVPEGTMEGSDSDVILSWWSDYYNEVQHFTGAGDLDGDGLMDIALGDPTHEDGDGRAYVFPGADLGL